MRVFLIFFSFSTVKARDQRRLFIIRAIKTKIGLMVYSIACYSDVAFYKDETGMLTIEISRSHYYVALRLIIFYSGKKIGDIK